jgi:adenylate cyclase
VTVIFADVRGSTAIAENTGPSEFAALLNRFYEVAMSALLPRNAVIDKMIGDEVMAFFIPAFHGEPQKAAMKGATDILRGVGYGSGKDPWLPVGIGINFGEAYVGKVGTVNTAARLQAHAKAGEVVVSESVYSYIDSQYPGVQLEDLEVRGREETFGVHVIRPV